MTRTCRWGKSGCRAEGSSGGHHGLESIEQQLATREYPRLRLGIGRRADDDRQITDYVLGRFAAGEREIVEEVLDAGRPAGGMLVERRNQRSNESI